MSDRDESGRFTKGNKGGPGNPYARQVAAMRSTLLAAITEDDLREVATALLSRAKAGDTSAAKLLFSYVVGRPDAPVNPDRLEIEEAKLKSSKANAEMVATFADLGIT